MTPKNNTKTIASGDNSQAAGGNINNTTNNIVATSLVIIFDPQKLADIINALNECMVSSDIAMLNDFEVVGIAEKNELNSISDEFYNDGILEDFEYFSEFEKFFKNPNNSQYAKKYKHILAEIRKNIIARQNAGESMESIIATLFDFAKQTEGNRALFNDNLWLSNILSSFMYARCDIGRKNK